MSFFFEGDNTTSSSFWSCKLKGKLGDTFMTTITCYVHLEAHQHHERCWFSSYPQDPNRAAARPAAPRNSDFTWNHSAGCSSKSIYWLLFAYSKKMATVTESSEKKAHPAWGTRLSFLSKRQNFNWKDLIPTLFAIISDQNQQYDICKKKVQTGSNNSKHLLKC